MDIVACTSPASRIYRSEQHRAEVSDECAESEVPPPVPRPIKARRRVAGIRIANAETLRVNRARRREIADRRWRNDMRLELLVFKGGLPSTSPFCIWINDPMETPRISADWRPPPPSPKDECEEPPF